MLAAERQRHRVWHRRDFDRIADLHRRLVEYVDVLGIGADVDRAATPALPTRDDRPGETHRQATNPPTHQSTLLHGKTRSIFRQSCCADAHLDVQSGAWLNRS